MSRERKRDHLQICLEENVISEYNYWDDITLVHRALPEIDMDDIDTSISLFGKKLRVPLIISGMTGGYELARTINRNLAEAAANAGIGLGVGSQRPALEDPSLESTYSVVKDFDIPLIIANLGVPQLMSQEDEEPFSLDEGRRAMKMVDADVLAIHLNYLQEVVQPEGEKRARGCLDAIKKIAIHIPVLAKETGAGISREVALALKKSMVKGIDVGGLSGTSFSAVEYYRARSDGDEEKMALGKMLWNWGIPTPVSVLWSSVGLPIVATGGIRNGLDVARAIALGADCAGIASRLLKSATESADAVKKQLTRITEELKAVMFLTGSSSADELASKSYVVSGPTASWLSETEGIL